MNSKSLKITGLKEDWEAQKRTVAEEGLKIGKCEMTGQEQVREDKMIFVMF